MALIKLGGLAQDVRGSLNGSTFSRNRGGAYIRSKVSPIQPVSPYSAGARAGFRAIAQAWATIGQPNMALWRDYASTHPYTNVFGDTVILSGIAMFQATNRGLLQIGGEITNTPPTTPIGDIGGLSATIVTTGGVPLITLIPLTPPTAPQGLYVFATQPLTPSRIAQKNQLRLINTPTTGPFITTFVISTPYLNRFSLGAITPGSTVLISARAIDPSSGSQSGPYETLVTATGT